MGFEKDIAVIIPALNPDMKLITLVEQLRNVFSQIVIVDDGSNSLNASWIQRSSGSDDAGQTRVRSGLNQYVLVEERVGLKNGGGGVFEQCINQYNVTVLRHAVNLGKGRALKTAFNYLLTCPVSCRGVVCADSDGQHSVEDIIKCAKLLYKDSDNIILGVRSFSAQSVPFRSRIGNKLTSHVLRLLCGIRLTDTQTGLRGIPFTAMKKFLNVPGERYEYELNMILKAKELGYGLREFPISTIYIDNNKESHFNPLRDSLRIYSVFGKFLFAGLSSFILDIVLFYFLIKLLNGYTNLYIYISTLLARIISSIYNYSINKNKVFKNFSRWSTTLTKYYALCFAQMAVSAICVNFLCSYFMFGELPVKTGVDTLLFLIGFQIQREWVFKVQKGPAG